jgi:hypothetical protein
MKLDSPWKWNTLAIVWNSFFLLYEAWCMYSYTMQGNKFGFLAFHVVGFCFFGVMLTNAIVWRREHPKPKEI